MTPVYFVDILRDIVADTSTVLLQQLQAVDPLITGINFQYGHYNDVRQQQMQKGKTDKTGRTPLFWLIEDYTIRKGQLGLTGVAMPRILIAHTTKKEYTRQQREDRVIRPVLYLIYDEFIRRLKLSGKFMIYDITLMAHNFTVRHHTGVDPKYDPSGYFLDDVLDGIELTNFELKTYLSNCQ
jgi:hypothetical protein